MSGSTERVYVQTIRRAKFWHDLADDVWDEATGEYLIAVNEDGSKKHADDCRGCAAIAALDSLAAALQAAEEALALAKEQTYCQICGVELAEASTEGADGCELCRHPQHEPGRCSVNIGTGYNGPVLCRCGASEEADG